MLCIYLHVLSCYFGAGRDLGVSCKDRKVLVQKRRRGEGVVVGLGLGGNRLVKGTKKDVKL
jgi:hypothetical protein